MGKKISPRDLGNKIKSIRKQNGFSQEDLARILEIPRSSMVKIEKGTRSVSLLELVALSEALGFSIDKFLISNYEPDKGTQLVHEPVIESDLETERISVPTIRRSKLEAILLYITGECGALPNMDLNLLLNILYFCDYNYYEIHEEQLSGLLYTKQSYGPSSDQLMQIIKEMESDKLLLKFKSSYSGKPQTKYLPSDHPNLKEINAAEKKVIDQVLEHFCDWPASILNEYSKEDMPWKASNLGEAMDYELVFYRKPPYAARIYTNKV